MSRIGRSLSLHPVPVAMPAKVSSASPGSRREPLPMTGPEVGARLRQPQSHKTPVPQDRAVRARPGAPVACRACCVRQAVNSLNVG